MRTAVRSGKTTIENEQDIGSAFEIGKLNTFTQEIFQYEIGGGGINSDLCHKKIFSQIKVGR